MLKLELKEVNGVKIENILWDSSNVLKTSYNYSTKQLFITFKRGGVYYYNDVPETKYNKLKESTSVGSFVNKNIVKEHTCIKVGTAQEENITNIIKEIEEIITIKQNGK